MTTWLRCYWDEEDARFHFALDAHGWVVRQVELQGPELPALAAASRQEWQQAYDAGRLEEYESWFGVTAEPPLSEGEGHDPERLTFGEFGEFEEVEEVWAPARQRLASRPR